MKQVVPNEPLLYIVQPNLEPKMSYMQQTFQAKKHAPARAGKAKREEQAQAGAPMKQFQQMTLEEQIQFLTKLPNQLSPIKCKLTTKKGEYKGFVQEYRNGHVKLQAEKGNLITVPFKHIVSLSLIGFDQRT